MYARLGAAMHPHDVDEIEKAVASGGPAANGAKRRVAREIVALYHDPDAARTAEAAFDARFRPGGQIDEAPPFSLTADTPVHLPALMAAAGLAASSSAARRLIDEGAVRVDGERLEPKRYDLDRSELVGRILAVGKRRAVRLTEA
jgi:tyrosyl-tRNA synthetase